MASRQDLVRVLRERDFRRLLVTRMAAQTADGVFQLGLASFVFFSPEKQTDAGKAAAAFATLLLPYSLVGPFAGVFIDRWRRQRILVVANLLRAATVVGVAAVVGARIDDWRFFAIALAVLSVNRFFLTSLSAALPHVVRPDLLVMANAVSTTSGTVVAVFGAGIGLAVRQVAGDAVAPILLTAAAIYLASGLLATRMRGDLLGPDLEADRPETAEALRRVLSGISDGARHVWHRRRAGRALAAIAAHRFFYGISTIATLLLYRNFFRDDGLLQAGLAGLGQVFIASALGVLTAAVVTPVVTRRISKESWIWGCFAGASVVEVALGFPYTKGTFLAAAYFLGLVAQGSKICVDTIVQQSVEDAYRGRVFAFYDILFNVSFVSAAVVGALALPESGKSYAVLGLIAVGYAVTALVYRRASGRSLPGGAGPPGATVVAAATSEVTPAR